MFVALSEDPDFYKDKISLFVALAPITKVTNSVIHMSDWIDEQLKIIAANH